MIEVKVAGSVVEPGLNAAIGDFVSQQLWGAPGKFGPHSSMGVFLDRRIIGGIVYHNYYPQHGVIEISGAATDKRWLSRDALRTMFEIPFRRFGCQLVAMRVSEFNAPTIEILERFGFTANRIPRLRGRGEAELIFTLTDDQWRQHPLLTERKHGQVVTPRAA